MICKIKNRKHARVSVESSEARSRLCDQGHYAKVPSYVESGMQTDKLLQKQDVFHIEVDVCSVPEGGVGNRWHISHIVDVQVCLRTGLTGLPTVYGADSRGIWICVYPAGCLLKNTWSENRFGTKENDVTLSDWAVTGCALVSKK